MKLDSMSSALAVYKALHGSWFKGIYVYVYVYVCMHLKSKPSMTHLLEYTAPLSNATLHLHTRVLAVKMLTFILLSAQ